MDKHRFAHKLKGELVLDLCFRCQGIWFDHFESVQLAPGGIVELFELIHRHRDGLRLPLAEVLRCPRCDERLLHGMDMSRSGRFNYHRCLQQHGRFTTFGQFMIEKGFVRQLAPLEIDQLAARIGVVRCNGCGAPVDIRKQHACSHCQSPIAILDPDAVEAALNRYRQAEIRRNTQDVEALADALLEQERTRLRQEREARQERLDGLDVGDLIVSGFELVWQWLRH